jgi:hypothetical protein
MQKEPFMLIRSVRTPQLTVKFSSPARRLSVNCLLASSDRHASILALAPTAALIYLFQS